MMEPPLWLLFTLYGTSICSGFAVGAIIGHRFVTKKLDVELRDTKRDLAAVLRTIELKKN